MTSPRRDTAKIAAAAGFLPQTFDDGTSAFIGMGSGDMFLVSSADGLRIGMKAEAPLWNVSRLSFLKNGEKSIVTVSESLPLEIVLGLRKTLPKPRFSSVGEGAVLRYGTWHELQWGSEYPSDWDRFERRMKDSSLRVALEAGFELSENDAGIVLQKFDPGDDMTWFEISAEGNIRSHACSPMWNVRRIRLYDGDEFITDVREKTTLAVAVERHWMVPDPFKTKSYGKWSTVENYARINYPG